ncbi:unnamed protein product [Sphagnum jensenii]|uniref:Protein SQS1 n=1 Tax=Sphagnum jensenii TaxID=128206 RepID=A0ABP0WN21_9BRYO
MVRGRGRGRGGGRGRQGGRDQTSGGSGQARQGNGGARQNGFVGGGALGDWEATPNLASGKSFFANLSLGSILWLSSVNSRKGRTQGGVNGSASGRQQTSNGRPVSKRKHPIARPAQNTFTSVGYSYGDRDDARKMRSTRGLGFAEEEDQLTSVAEVLQLGPAADNLDVESNVNFKKDEDVAAVETMNVEPQGHHSAVQLEQKTAGGKTSSVSHKSKKKMHNSRTPNSKISSGFLRIGGVRVWTDQGSSCGNEHLDEEEDTSGLSRNAYRGSDDSSSVSEESNSDPISSDVSDEMAEDYLSNVGVGLGSLDASWLLRDKLFEHSKGKEVINAHEESNSELDELAEALHFEEGFVQSSDGEVEHETVAALWKRDLQLDDNDKSQVAGRQTVSMHASAWPINVHKGKKKKHIPGEKKQQRKEQIAAKRQIRAQCRGFDLAAVNAALEEVVTKSVDIFAFEPMEDRDRAQIHKLASIYRLKSSSQGSGKRRFVVVTHTRHTSLPTGIDKDRLLFMLGRGAEVGMPDSSRAMTSKGHKMVKKSNGHGQRSTEKRGQGTTAYASKPMSFVSSGIIRSQEESPSLVVASGFPLGSHALGITEKGERSSKEAAGLTEIKDIAVVASAIGTFEAHTRGFGSRMMSKMGFQEGQGLGKDGQGIASPVEAVKRPKSLGLGAYAATT